MTIKVDIVSMMKGRSEVIPIINRRTPLMDFSINEDTLKKIIQIPTFIIYEAGTKSPIDGKRLNELFNINNKDFTINGICFDNNIGYTVINVLKSGEYNTYPISGSIVMAKTNGVTTTAIFKAMTVKEKTIELIANTNRDEYVMEYKSESEDENRKYFRWNTEYTAEYINDFIIIPEHIQNKLNIKISNNK